MTLEQRIEALERKVVRLENILDVAEPSITCPKCGRTSFNSNDIAQGYCVMCADWTTPSRSQGDAGPEYYRNKAKKERDG
jgi:hypothetical protein